TARVIQAGSAPEEESSSFGIAAPGLLTHRAPVGRAYRGGEDDAPARKQSPRPCYGQRMRTNDRGAGQLPIPEWLAGPPSARMAAPRFAFPARASEPDKRKRSPPTAPTRRCRRARPRLHKENRTAAVSQPENPDTKTRRFPKRAASIAALEAFA